LIDPNGTAIRRENDQRHHDEKKHERPNVFGRNDLKHKGHKGLEGKTFVLFVSACPRSLGVVFKKV
jgi:hypothetical protein